MSVRTMMKLALAAFGGAALAGMAGAQDLLIRNARIETVTGPAIERGSILVLDGRVAGVGEVDPARAARVPAAAVIDAGGRTVYPGLFAAYSQVGLVEIGAVRAVNDADEGTGVNVAEVNARDAYNPQSEVIPVTRMNGVTTALVAPATGNVIVGQGFVTSLAGETVDESTDLTPAGLFVAIGEVPKSRFDDRNQMPSTRMGIAAVLRAEFQKAREYQRKRDNHATKIRRWEAEKAAFPAKLDAWRAKPEADRGDEPSEPKEPDAPSRDWRMEALGRALRNEIPVGIEAHRLDDIETAVRIADEFRLSIVLIGGADAYKMASILAERKIPVIVQASQQPDSLQGAGAVYENARILNEKGVKISFMTGDTTHNVRNLPYEAGLAVAHGLPREVALRAITVTPAEIWRCEDRVGGLREGVRANLFIADGDPLQATTNVTTLVIGGRVIPVRSRQTELAERYGQTTTPGRRAP